MSNGAVDTKTVEMRFDNSDFESNVKQTMSTLEKLKRALKLDGASAGLEEIERASKKLDFKDYKKSVDDVGNRFNILEKIATGVLYKIGASAAEAGAKLVKSMTIDNIAAGWDKYAQKTTAVQTIMANLRKDEGEFIDEASKMDYVNERLEKLMWFSDETSYSFTDMTSNVGKFIANGTKLDESVTAMQGIATWAAMSGQNAQVAARAMYNISQALGVGSMKIMDWKSIENANMATAAFKELAITVGQKKGKIKEGQVSVENFRESLSGRDTGGWFDKEVMMEVFSIYGEAADKIYSYTQRTGKIATEVIRDIRDGNEDIAKEVGITADSIGFKALQAAQEAKTWQEVVKATADAVSTKWSRIFESIFGNYLEAKELWTDLSNDLWDIFASPLDTVAEIMDAWKNGFFKNGPQNILQQWYASGHLDALNNGLNYISDSVAELAVKSDKAHYKIETLEDGTRQLVKLVERAPGKYERVVKKIYEADKDLLSGRDMLISGFRNILRTLVLDWEETDEKTGKKTKRLSIFGALRESISEFLFGTSKIDKIIPIVSKKLWDATKRFQEFTERLVPSVEKTNKLKNSFKGLLTVFKIGGKIFSPVFKEFQKLFGMGTGFKKTDKTLLDLADSVSTWIQNLDKWIDKSNAIGKISKVVGNAFGWIKSSVNGAFISLTGLTAKDWASNIKKNIFSFFENYDYDGMFNSISGFFTGIVEQVKQVITDDLPEKLTPLQKFLVVSKKVFTGIKKFFLGIIPALGWVGTKIGGAFISITDGFRNAITQIKQVATGDLPKELTPLQKFLVGIGKVFTFFKTTFQNFVKGVKSFKLSDLKNLLNPIKSLWTSSKTFIESIVNGTFKEQVPAGMSKATKRLAPIIKAFSSIFKGLGNLFDSLAPYIEKIGQGIGEFLTLLGSGLNKLIGNKSGLEVLADIIKLFKDFSVARFINSLAKLDNRFSKLIKVFTKQTPKMLKGATEAFRTFLGDTKTGIGGFFKSILEYVTKRKTVGKALIEDLESIRDIFKAYRRQINAEALIDFAVAIGILAGSLFLVAQVPPERLVTVGNAIGHLAVVVAGLYAVGKLMAGLEALISSKLRNQNGNPIVNSIKDILTSVVKSSVFANDATAKFLKFAAGVALIAAAIKMISGSMKQIGEGVIEIGKAYADPHFKDGLKALGFLAGGLALVSLIGGLGGGGVFLSITTFVLFILFIKKAKLLVEQISEVGKSTNANNFYKGLEYIGWLLTGIAALNLISSIGGFGTKLVGMLGSIVMILALTRFIRKISEALSSLAKGTTPGSMQEAADAIMSIARPLLKFIGLLSLLATFRSGRRAVRGATLAVLVGLLAIRSITSSLVKLAKIKDADSIRSAGEVIASVARTMGWTIGALTLLSGLSGGLKFGGNGVSYNGTKIPWAAIGFLGACYGIALMVRALKDVSDSGKTADFKTAGDTIFDLVFLVGGVTALLSAIGGLNVIAGKSGFSGVLGSAFGAAAFVGVCFGIKLMIGAVRDLAATGSVHDIEQAGEIVGLLTSKIGLWVGLLGVMAGLNVNTGAINYIGPLGVPLGAIAFVGICWGVSMMAKAVAMLATSANSSDIEKAANVLAKLTGTIGLVVGLLGAEGGLGIFFGAGFFLPTVGMVVAALSFGSICESVISIAESLAMLANAAKPDDVESAGEVLKSLIWTITGVLALLGAEGGLGLFVGIGVIAPGLGMLAAGDSFKKICEGLVSMAEALTDVAYASDVGDIEKAGKVLESMTSTTGWITALVSAVGGIVGNKSEKGADAFKTVAEGVNSIAEAVAELSTIDYDNFSPEVINDLKNVIDTTTGIFAISVGDAFVSSSTMTEKANAFNSVIGSVKDIMQALSAISEVGNLSDITGVVANLESVINAATKVFATGFGDNFKPNEYIDKARAFATIAGPVVDMLKTISELSNLGGLEGLDAEAGQKIGSTIQSFIDEIVSSYTSGLQSGKQNVTDSAFELTTAVQNPIVSIITDSSQWGEDLAYNFASGIRSGADFVSLAATYVAETVRGILGFSEPDVGPLSDFHTYAPDMIKLWCKGVDDNLGLVKDSSYGVADTVYDGFSTALDYVSGLIDNGMSDQLTIRPIMDLSEIQNGVKSMDGMLSSNGYVISGTTRLAASAAYGIRSNATTSTEPSMVQTDVGPTNNNFYITNSDPNAVAEKVSKILGNQTRRQKAVWAYK